MADYGRFGDAITSTIYFMFFSLCVFVPLGIWKIIDILVWVYLHVQVGIKP